MPARYKRPGVYIKEGPLVPRAITGVSSSIALFVGTTSHGPPNQAVELAGIADYERTFGSDTQVGETADQVRQFFVNGGRRAYVVRTSPTDGSKPGPDDYASAYATARREIDLFNLLVLPRALGRSTDEVQSDPDRALLWGPASIFCEERRAVLLMDPPQAWSDPAAARDGIAALRAGVVGDHAMVAWPRLQIADPGTGRLRSIDPAGSIAGLLARTDSADGVWKPPAGPEATILGVGDVEHQLSDAADDLLNRQAINAVRRLPVGIVLWGVRTLAGYDGSGESDFRYLPVRRTALFLEESLRRGLQWTMFEANAEPLWARIRRAVDAFMSDLFRRGAFQGRKPSEAYFVRCGTDTTTQADIDRGIVNVIVGFAPLKPAEFIIIRIPQKVAQTR